MTQNIPHKAHSDRNSNNRQVRLRPRGQVEAMLREIAFVLKMTRRVRDEMQADQEAKEPVLA